MNMVNNIGRLLWSDIKVCFHEESNKKKTVNVIIRLMLLLMVIRLSGIVENWNGYST